MWVFVALAVLFVLTYDPRSGGISKFANAVAAEPPALKPPLQTRGVGEYKKYSDLQFATNN